jgi:apolipoprotein N-acyltransferase
MKTNLLNSQRLKYFIAFISGAMLVAAFSPFNISYLAIASSAILLYLLIGQSENQAAIIGLFFGIGLFGIGASWVFVSIHEFGNTNVFVASILTILFIFILSLFTSLQSYCFARFYNPKLLKTLFVVYPSLWFLFEWIRGWLFTGFPWLFLGYSQTNSILSGYLPVIGVYGTSFVVALCGALIVAIFISIKQYIEKTSTISKCIKYVFMIAIIFAIGFFTSKTQWTTKLGIPIKTSLIQGNIAQQVKWSPDMVIPTMTLYKNLTEKTLGNDIIIWPEAAIPVTKNVASPYIKLLGTEASLKHSAIITGIPEESINGNFFNSVTTMGLTNGTYYKQHLVPFGEYVPFQSLLRGIINFFDLPMSDFSPGPQNQELLNVFKYKAAVFVCYEIAFTDLVIEDLPKANFLVVVSNDSWFGKSFAAWQHLQIAQTRSIETGRYTLFCSNNGVTAIIDNHGNIIKIAPRFETFILTGEFIPMAGLTPWARTGSKPFVIIILLLLIFFSFKKNK